MITGAGTATCQSVIKGLRSQSELKVRIVTTDMNPHNAGRYFSEVFSTVPPASEDRFITVMLEICKKERVRLLIPIVDYEFAKLSAARGEFEKIGCRVAISNPDVIGITTDKWHLFKYFREKFIPTPETFLISKINSKKLKFPVFVKPRILGRASLNTFKAETRKELDDLIMKFSDCLVQEYKQGDEFTVDTLSDLSGKCVGAVVRKRVEVKAGVSYKGITVDDEEIKKMAIAIVEGLPILGPANVQCFRKGNEVSFFDVNPRFSGTLVLSIAAGFNSPLYLAKLALGQKMDPGVGKYKKGVTMYRFWQEVFTDEKGSKLTAPTMNG